MDAIVLVGGQGTRLRPLTLTRHKSLVPICNRPYMGYLFDWLRRSGFERVILALGQNNEDLAEAYPAGRRDGLEVVVVQEHARLESGGAIRNAFREAQIQGRFAVVNGDVMLDFDFKKALAAHEAASAELTLALYEMADVSQFGVAVTDADGMVIGFVEKPPLGTEPSTLVNAGAWIFEPQLIDDIPPGPVRVEETLFPSLVGRGRRVLGYRFEGLWADVGTAARYLAVNQALMARGRNCVADSASIAQGATVESSCVGDGTAIAAGAGVRGSVLWENVMIGEGAIVEESILADGVVVGAGATLRGTVAGRNAHIGPHTMALPGTSIDPGARYDAGNER